MCTHVTLICEIRASNINFGTKRWFKESLKKKPENCKKGCYYNDSKQNLKWSMEDFEATMFEEAGELSDSEDEDVFEKPSKRKSKAEAKSGKTCIKY